MSWWIGLEEDIEIYVESISLTVDIKWETKQLIMTRSEFVGLWKLEFGVSLEGKV